MIPKLRILFWVGLIIIFVPYLGIRGGVRTALTILLGALVIWLSFRIRKEYKALKFRMRRLEEPTATPELTTNGQ